MKSLFRITIILFLFLFSFTNKAQAQIPPDTTTYWVINESGVDILAKRSPDSLMIPGYIIVRFRQDALDYKKLLKTYFYWFNGLKSNGRQLPQSGIFQVGDQRGFPDSLRYLLMTENFCLNSSSNIIVSDPLKNFLISSGATCIQRLTTASPYDTLSVTRTGDTIGCDHYNWMVINLDSAQNPLLVASMLMYLFPDDIIIATPDYEGKVPLKHPCDDRTLYDTCQYSLYNMINAETAWDYEVGDSSVLMAHYDEGIDFRHPDLGGVIGPGTHIPYAMQYYFPLNSGPDAVWANSGHGTPCAGIMGALTNRNHHSIAGIAGGWGNDFQMIGCDSIDRGKGASLVLLADNSRARSRYYVHAIFEASARSPITGYGYGVHVINTSANVDENGIIAQPMHGAINYAFENGVVLTAAFGQAGVFPWNGIDETTMPRTFPACYDDPWIISVAGADPIKGKVHPSNWGYTLDLLAPAGDPSNGGGGRFDTSGGTILNGCYQPGSFAITYTTHSNWQPTPPNFFFAGFGGNSAAAPHVAGSVALLQSYFHRLSPTFFGLEPEDYAGILKASAWRGSYLRDTSNLENSWYTKEGWGHLDIGKAFTMLDPDRNKLNSGYEVHHFSYSDSLQYGDWLDSGQWFFDISWSPKMQRDTNLIKRYAHRSYLLNYQGNNIGDQYAAIPRYVTRTVTLDSMWDVSPTNPLFAWGRSGGLNEKSGWSMAQFNWQTGWSRVTSGSGGNNLNEGIYHSGTRKFTIETVQYDVWGWDKPSKTYSRYLGHIPPDSMMGVNFTVFGRTRPEFSAVEKVNKVLRSTLEITSNNSSNTITAKFMANDNQGQVRLELFDMLGKLIYSSLSVYINEGMNTITVSQSLQTGTYIGRVTGLNLVESKRFQVIK